MPPPKEIDASQVVIRDGSLQLIEGGLLEGEMNANGVYSNPSGPDQTAFNIAGALWNNSGVPAISAG